MFNYIVFIRFILFPILTLVYTCSIVKFLFYLLLRRHSADYYFQSYFSSFCCSYCLISFYYLLIFTCGFVHYYEDLLINQLKVILIYHYDVCFRKQIQNYWSFASIYVYSSNPDTHTEFPSVFLGLMWCRESTFAFLKLAKIPELTTVIWWLK